MYDLSGKSIFVTGHKGLVGSAICRALSSKQNVILLTADRSDLDLTDRSAVDSWMDQHRPEVVIHAAGRVGGIAVNSKYPVEFLNDNLYMAQNVINSSYTHKVKKLAFLGSSCIYPKEAPQPIEPSSLLTLPLEESNEAYALAKIVGVRLCKYYREEYGANFISLMPCNLYGPGDTYDAFSSHVIPALILKMHNAKVMEEPSLKMWGTGRALREFLYSDDVAEAVLTAIEHYNDSTPLNIGSSQEVSIAELATNIAEAVGYKGELRFDMSGPDGTMRKVLNSDMIRGLGWLPKYSLEEGLKRSYDDFLSRDIEQKL